VDGLADGDDGEVRVVDYAFMIGTRVAFGLSNEPLLSPLDFHYVFVKTPYPAQATGQGFHIPAVRSKDIW
jgi:hypothetical protein